MELSPQKLPQAEKTQIRTIKGDKVQKQTYADGSYGILAHNKVKRYFPDGKQQTYVNKNGDFILETQTLPNGTKREFYENGNLSDEYLPDGTQRHWYQSGQLQWQTLPNGTYCRWYESGQIEK